MTRPTTPRDDIGSLLPAARYARSAQALGAVLSRAVPARLCAACADALARDRAGPGVTP